MLDLRLKTVKQTVALGRSMPSNSASRSKCARRPLSQNLCTALEPDSGGLPPRAKLQRLLEILRSDSFSLCSRKTQLTSRSESPAVSWPTWSAFLGGCAKSWLGMSDGHERPPSQNGCSISQRSCSWSGTTKLSLNIDPLPIFDVNVNV